jgi:hypothetical protein
MTIQIQEYSQNHDFEKEMRIICFLHLSLPDCISFTFMSSPDRCMCFLVGFVMVDSYVPVCASVHILPQLLRS